jgi:hypothetical protein
MPGSDTNLRPRRARQSADCRISAARISLRILMIFVSSLMLGGTHGLAFAACPERPACRGCGCKGGPGYRGPDGRCVGFQALDKVCGRPPETRCTFENAPGTAANRDCARAGAETKKTR